MSIAAITDLGMVATKSPLRRIPAAAKFAALFVLAIAIYVTDSWTVIAIGLALSLAALALSAVPLARMLKALTSVLILIVIVAAIAAITRGPASAAIYGTRLLTLCLFAYAVTATTPFSEMLAVFQTLLTPAERVGLPSAQISLALAMTVRSIPRIRDNYLAIREAQFARGLANSPRAILVPLIATTLTDARGQAAAIDARCYDAFGRANASGTDDTGTENTVLVASLAAVIAALGLVPPIAIGVIPVPITLQTLGVMLAGALLGPWRGMFAALAVVTLGFAGLPLFAGGSGGLGVLLGASGGYAVGWVPGAFVVGLLVKHIALRPPQIWARYILVTLSAIIGGIVVVYAFGVPWMAISVGISLKASLVFSFSFIPGDSIKAVIAAAVTVTLLRRYPNLISTS